VHGFLKMKAKKVRKGEPLSAPPLALKPLIFAEDDETVLIASEEIALRRVAESTDLKPRELGAGEVRWWLR